MRRPAAGARLLALLVVLALPGCAREPEARLRSRDTQRGADALAAAAGRLVAPDGGVPLLRRLALPDLGDAPDSGERNSWRTSAASLVAGAVLEDPVFVAVVPAPESELGCPNGELFVDERYLVRITLGEETRGVPPQARAEIRIGPAPGEAARLPFAVP